MLKSLAFANRGEAKAVYDLIYALRRWPDGTSDIADRLGAHATQHPDIVQTALQMATSTICSAPAMRGDLPSAHGPLKERA